MRKYSLKNFLRHVNDKIAVIIASHTYAGNLIH